MNTPTPINNGINALAAVTAALPDEATLNRLASEFFAALPGTKHTSPPAPAIDRPASSLRPAANAQIGTAEVLVESVVATGKPGTSVLGVPEAFAALLPSVSSSQLPAAAPAQQPTPPYYFLGESGAYSTTNSPTKNLVLSDDRITTQTFGLPGAEALRVLLNDVSEQRDPGTPPQNPREFYFLDKPSFAFDHRLADDQLPALPTGMHPAFDVNAARRDFPILQERVNGRPLIWLDNAATTHKPQAVIDRLAYFYAHENSNIHRAAHELAARATDAYESARNKVARFLGASSADEIVFVRGATEAINLVAKTWGKQHIGAGDEILISLLEHHANIVPWQQLAQETGAIIRVVPVDDTGQLLLEEYRRLLTPRTKLVAVTQVSNALGTVTPIKEIVDLAHRNGSCVLVDGAQAVSHLRVNVQTLDADFYVFSGHKVFAPTGIGVVYGKRKILESMQPWQGGGNMIADVTFERTVYQPAPARFEAGTGNIADAVGLGAAIDYLERIGVENVARYEHDLLVYATHALTTISGLRLIGTAADKTSVMSFVLDGYTTEEVGKALNQEGIAVRSGHHCAQPILRRFGVESTVRPSLAFYNTNQEIDVLVATLHQLCGQRRLTR